jgi:hypothetical protein
MECDIRLEGLTGRGLDTLPLIKRKVLLKKWVLYQWSEHLILEECPRLKYKYHGRYKCV